MRATWVFAVLRSMERYSAMKGALRPSASRPSTSCSRAVSCASAASRAMVLAASCSEDAAEGDVVESGARGVGTASSRAVAGEASSSFRFVPSASWAPQNRSSRLCSLSR